ncbi:MAG: hypothetical protein WCB90_13980 [Methanosarcina sp.]|uniref:hypothetical protein n=1 Tax=Methanosarcina sp. TaxID=2213 RepID=UPI003BB6C450
MITDRHHIPEAWSVSTRFFTSSEAVRDILGPSLSQAIALAFVRGFRDRKRQPSQHPRIRAATRDCSIFTSHVVS